MSPLLTSVLFRSSPSVPASLSPKVDAVRTWSSCARVAFELFGSSFVGAVVAIPGLFDLAL